MAEKLVSKEQEKEQSIPRAESYDVTGGDDVEGRTVRSIDSNKLDIDLETRHYLLAGDGRTVLIPQPVADPQDPLNWSWAKKHMVLLVIAATAFLPDYGSATGAVTLVPQGEEWNISPDTVIHSQSGNVFMLGAGGVIVVILSAYFGRLPILFWFAVCAVWTAAGCAAAPNFDTFMAFRILNGFFSTVAQGGGVMFIKDLFFFHERARKINIWASFYCGQLVAAFIIDTQKWQWPFWVYTIMTSLCLIAIVIFGEETFFNRKMPAEQRPQRTPGVTGQVSRLVGVEQWRSRHQRNTFYQAAMRSVVVLAKPTVFISFIYYLFISAWVFGPKQIGFFYFTPVVAAILGEIVGRCLHDRLAVYLTHRSSDGKLKAEYRLMAISVSTPFMVVGIIVLGFALENEWHYMVAAVGWGLYVFGIMITTVAITAYNLDCYPEGSGETAAWLTAARTTGGFIVSYFQVEWAKAMGTKESLGIQAAIVFIAYLAVVFLQVSGQRIRERSGPLRFKND